VLVSTSSGATGLLLLHLLRSCKANIIALASPHKQKHILPFTNCILDYKDKEKLSLQLKQLKFNKYFDNVGESLLDLVLETIEDHGVIALCGSIEHYSAPKEGGLVNYPCVASKRIRMEGIRFSSLIHRVD
jgi:NADPH-dependent curcumin reductase CurA